MVRPRRPPGTGPEPWPMGSRQVERPLVRRVMGSGPVRAHVSSAKRTSDHGPSSPGARQRRKQSPRPSVRATRERAPPLADGHLLALLGAADPDLRDAISILALSGMRLAELRRLRVGQCGRGSFRVGAFRVGACAANDGPREVPVHTALAGTVLRLTSGPAKDAFLIDGGADFGQARSALERRFDALWAAAVGAAWPSPGIGGLRLWFVAGALEAGQPPDAIAAVVGLFRPEQARPMPTWGQRRACVEAVTLPKAAL